MDLAKITFINSVSHTIKMVEIKRLNERLLIKFVNYHELFVLHVSCSISFSAKDTDK